MIPTGPDLKDAPNSSVLSALRNALFEHADKKRSFEESCIRVGAHSGWSAEGADLFRALIAAGAIVEHIIAEGVDNAMRAKADGTKYPPLRWLVGLSGSARAALVEPLPAVAVPPAGAPDAA